ncbi:hypothetical protein EAG_13844 [Camponotus floridanus]|uniref:Uncharacterized protein n=1 Tax=Camponotus floridanus TaxID=104421 RepID=E2AVL3_CAMFO|nr:hypothetical protein EAG_13844 [Camponotus floridanus]
MTVSTRNLFESKSNIINFGVVKQWKNRPARLRFSETLRFTGIIICGLWLSEHSPALLTSAHRAYSNRTHFQLPERTPGVTLSDITHYATVDGNGGGSNTTNAVNEGLRTKFTNIIVDISHLIKFAIYTGLTHHVIKTRRDVTRAAAASQLPVQHG